jgi:DNA polymerase III sliding clamp (beta) subunit (PCNA family)
LLKTRDRTFSNPRDFPYRHSSSVASGERKVGQTDHYESNIDIVANTPEVGEAKESLPVMNRGREYSIAFNPEFLMAPLRNLSEERSIWT